MTNPNLQVAASYVQKAIADLQRQMQDLRAQIDNIRRQTGQQVNDEKSQIQMQEIKAVDPDRESQDRATHAAYAMKLMNDIKQQEHDADRQVQQLQQQISVTERQMADLQNEANHLRAL